MLSVLGGVLWNTFIASVAQASLDKLDREVFPHDTESVLFVFGYGVVRIEILECQFEIMALFQFNIRLNEARP